MSKHENTKAIEKAVIRFAGDSGDGMQYAGSQFTFASALLGNDITTLPDFPAEIRAPKGSVGGISGFQVQIGESIVRTPGDEADVLVAMNPAALRGNLRWVRKGGAILLDSESFSKVGLRKAGYESNPLEDDSLADYKVIQAPMSSMSKKVISDIELDNKSITMTRNMFALGIIYWLYSRPLATTVKEINAKFGKKKPNVAAANIKVLEAGYFFAETIEAFTSNYKVGPAKLPKGKYRHISGNVATAWGLMAARERLGTKLFLGSYPITPASDILHELSKYKQMDVITLQAEDEIAAVCSSIGASYAGHLAVTTSSGPGIALKGEGIGLAAMIETPLVIVNVQRGGPSTGLPTKTEQSDLEMVLYGRNGESEVIVISPGTPTECFEFAYMAAKLAVEHMTPVFLMTDAYLANGSEPWKIPDMDKLPAITPVRAKTPAEGETFYPYDRDPESLVRAWVKPGTKGMEHRIGGLEKEDRTGNVSYDPDNHEKMIKIRAEKIARVANYIPELKVYGEQEGELLLIGWGGTYGALRTAVSELQDEGHKVSLAHFNYINPLPKNTAEVLGKFKHRLVCELNLGQLANYLRTKIPTLQYEQYNKTQGLPLTIQEIKTKVLEILRMERGSL